MPSLASFVEAIGCVFLVACTSLAPIDEAISVEDVREVLRSRYPAKGTLKEGEFRFEAAARVVELELPHLSEGLAGAKFYRTEILTGYFEYPRAETVVLARRLGHRLAVFECRSPTFTPPSKDFLEQFRGLRAEGGRERIGEEIGKLFEAITFKGSLHDGHLGEGRYTVDLWHHHSIWRRVFVEFETDGSVKAVGLNDPHGLATRR